MVDTLIRHIIVGLIIWQVGCCYQHWVLAKRLLERLARQRARQGRRKRAKDFKGLTKKPACAQCETEEPNDPSFRGEPPPRLEPKRGRKRCVRTGHHYCPYQNCRYYGWLGLGNISSNGHPNGGRNRQLYCCVCERYFAETKGTLFYGKRYRPQDIEQALTALAEGLGIRAVGRVFKVAPDTVLDWLLEAGTHLAAFSDYLVRELAVEQVQLDELFGLIRALKQGEMERQEAIERLDRPWLWAAIDPVSKFWLATALGPRTTALAQRLVHQVVKRLKVDQVPLFMTDGCGVYEPALLAHYGQWRAPEPGSGQRKARWWPRPELQYVQVIKKRARRRLVSVTKRVVFGSRDLIRQQLAAHGWQINTAFIERLNLSIRQHVPGLGRRVNTLALSSDGLAQQVGLFQVYYNFCLPHASLKMALENECSRKKWQPRSPAMAIGLTDHLWSLGEVLAFRVPPWPQSETALAA